MPLKKKKRLKTKKTLRKPSSKKPLSRRKKIKPAKGPLRRSSSEASKVHQRRPAKVKKKIVKIKKPAKEIPVGKVTHYFPKVQAAVIKITKDKIILGDNLRIKGSSTDFTQVADSIQIDRVPVPGAKKGQEIGLRVNSRAREGDLVYKA